MSLLGEGKSLVLSFDDGPQPVSALDSILATLKNNGIKAEFYVLGIEVERAPKAAARIVSQGHRIQNHSWDHPDLAKVTEETVLDQLQRTQLIIREKTHTRATRIRPPYGSGGWKKKDPELAKVAKQLALTIHNWDIDTEDWRKPRGIGETKIQLVKGQFQRKKEKEVLNVLMHVQDETARDLVVFIKQLKEWGFGFADPRP